jgi:hypothetical protein
MSELNQYAVSRILGSTMRPAPGIRFGNFGLLGSTGEVLRAARPIVREKRAHFTYEQDRFISRAFEKVRDGSSPDSILWDRSLASAFAEACRKLGLDAPEAILNRRLINIRKNKTRYANQGIVLSPTTKNDPHPSIVPQYAHVIEFALVRLRYGHGASIDDILLDPLLGREFEDLTLGIAPQLSPQDVRLGALTIRKTRFLKKHDEVVESLNAADIERAATPAVSLSKISESEVPDGPGLVELQEGRRFLYIARNENLRPAVHEFKQGGAFRIMENGFWQPDFDEITLRYLPGTEFKGVGISRWECKLISERNPVFNWPVHHREAA